MLITDLKRTEPQVFLVAFRAANMSNDFVMR